MVHEVIRMRLSTSSIDDAIAALEQKRLWIEQKTKELNERLALIGTQEASSRFGGAIYDGSNDVQLTAEPTAAGWQIVAQGQAVFFIEFGAGVYYNGSEPYPDERPRSQGIVGIGEYGMGQGKRKVWYFKTASGEVVRTHGNPAAMPMFFAKEMIISRFADVAREVFG